MEKIICLLIFVVLFSFSAFAQNISANCPIIMISGGGILEAGKPMNFAVEVKNDSNNLNPKYEWKVSAGTIASGQGTSSIAVGTTGIAGGTNITAEVVIKGLPEGCPNTALETGAIPIQCYFFSPEDEFGRLPRNEVRARVDYLFAKLEEDQSKHGFFVNYGTDAEISRRENIIRDHINLRKYDLSRVTLLRGSKIPIEGAVIYTRLWALPEGQGPPVE